MLSQAKFTDVVAEMTASCRSDSSVIPKSAVADICTVHEQAFSSQPKLLDALSGRENAQLKVISSLFAFLSSLSPCIYIPGSLTHCAGIYPTSTGYQTGIGSGDFVRGGNSEVLMSV